MNYISTRNKNFKAAPSRAILDGIAPDGGLYVPESFPFFERGDLLKMSDMSYPERLAEVLSRFLTDFSKDELLVYAEKACEKFDGDPCPLVKIEEDVYVLELFHGATSAFKDMALSVMPYLMTAAKKKLNDTAKTLILVATSGDTGKSALEGFGGVEGTDIMVLYPKDGVSGVQKAQMTTSPGENVNVAAVNGNFDDAQTAVKKIFADKDIKEKLRAKNVELSSANSINIGRLIPQTAYYISAYLDLLGAGDIEFGEEVNFAVPTGNFGNILAAYYAKKAGLPVGKLVCASNKNNVLTDFFLTGEYNADRKFFQTASPSMDILISSNLERFLFDLSGEDDGLIAELMNDLKKKGKYSIGNGLLAKCGGIIFAGYADDKACFKTVKDFYESYDYVLDTHTAVAVSVLDGFLNGEAGGGAKTVAVSTASPYKFAADVYFALTGEKIENPFEAIKRLEAYTGAEVPDGLKDLDKKEERFKDVIEKDGAGEAVLRFANR
ncbi:MAG: threonine synthase [Clostridiales bacterium]|jgi:threonine synthase|nr:threonine synthase [Clostridiales bacterium]